MVREKNTKGGRKMPADEQMTRNEMGRELYAEGRMKKKRICE
jgi:hypothetical protein